MPARSIIAISGADRVTFLQGIVTQDVTKLAEQKIQFAALLSPQGKILHDMFLIDEGERILIDTQRELKETLIKRLTMYKLRAKVTIEDVSDVYFMRACEIGLPDPRHPEMPHRLYTAQRPAADAIDPGTISLALGIPELGRDFASDSVVAMDAGYDLLNAISFTKGCYVGQEVTARMHYKNIARRGFYIIDGKPQLSLLKFEEVEAKNGKIIVDNVELQATLPAWMLPKFQQFKAAGDNQ